MTRTKSSAQTAIKASALQREATRLRKQAGLLEKEAVHILTPNECQQTATAISKRKGNVAVFLGAGASKTLGWPLTNELLVKPEDKLRSYTVGDRT